MSRQIFIFIFLTLVSSILKAQYRHIAEEGVINYEFKINRYERANKLLGAQVHSTKYKDYVFSLQNNRFITRNYVLAFNKKHSSYHLTKMDEQTDFIDLSISIPTTNIMRDLNRDSLFIKKQFGEDAFLIADSLKKITWKYTDERIDILGYECRRVNGLIMDSVYVVAFYCPDISISAGPSIFGGLPGLILGVSLPQDNINIFATKISLQRTEDLGNENSNDVTSQGISFNQFDKKLNNLFDDRFYREQWNFNLRALHF